jgi:uncharacterized protein
MKRVFIVHGWEGYPEEGWFPWLKTELEKQNYNVLVPSMPNPSKPEILPWVEHLNKVIGKPDKDTYLVGHSIGCQTILHYLNTISGSVNIGGTIFVAGFVKLQNLKTDEEKKLAKRWLTSPFNWEKVKSLSKKFVAVFSDNDPWVPLSNSDVFKEKLAAKIIIESKRGHFSGSDGIKKLPVVLEELLTISK